VGVIGLAADLVGAPSRLRPAVDLLLGQTWVVQDRQTARRFLTGQPAWVRVVTLQGELFYASGPIAAGHSGKASTLSRPRQRRELGEQFDSLQKQVAGASQRIDGFESALAQMRSQETQLREALSGAQRQERAATEAHHQGLLGRDRARRQAQWQQEQRQKLEAEIKAGETEAREISGRIGQIAGAIREAQSALRDQQAALAAVSLEEFQDQLAHWSTLAAVAGRALSDAKSRQQERRSALAEAAQNVQALQTRLAALQDGFSGLGDKKEVLHAQDAEVVAKIAGLQQLIDPAEAELNVAEAEQEKLQGAEARARQALNVAERRYAQAQAMLARRQEGLDNLRERIEDDFGLVAFEYAEEISGPTPLPLSGMVEQLPMVPVLPEGLEETIKRQRLQLRRMGAINPEAQVEYREVNERFEFMTVQVADLHKAEADIREVIAELDVLMEREFRKTFDAVAVEFREIFTRLFGGGSARLVLTDPEDLTETGIDIEARLPGRRAQGLSLLSGGERSLTATALVFALLKVSPTPFCVLDEVDAMLDEANVGRFRDLLSELSHNTQFIVITHNRNTVQAAGVIYGVTMGRDSASQVISLKLDEVAEVV
jgi:chromosome segregation protein